MAKLRLLNPKKYLSVLDVQLGKTVFREEVEAGAVGVSLGLVGEDVFDLIETLGGIKDGLTANIYYSVVGIAADLLAAAQPRVPLDPSEKGGRLRKSGEAIVAGQGIGFKTVARGKKDGTIYVSPAASRKVNYENARTINANVIYTRYNEKGEDIALWTHEDLNPHGSSQRPRARTPGTGPKYLEQAWLENKYEFESQLSEAMLTKRLSRIMGTASRVKTQQKGFKVSTKKLRKQMLDQVAKENSFWGQI